MIRHVVWDWNGTLLDDVEACVGSLNTLITARALGAPLSAQEYRARFGFPVRAFYEDLGFDFVAEDFERLSHDFIAHYRSRADEHRLTSGAREVLDALAARGVEQLVVSALEERLLGDMLHHHGVRPYLRGFHGLGTMAASSKVDLGVSAMRAHDLRPQEVLFVGDTLHDHETATGMGVRCVLYAGGHQSRERLEAAGVPIIDSLAELPDHLSRG